jgi:hypothetical protein
MADAQSGGLSLEFRDLEFSGWGYFTWKVPSARRGQDLRQALFLQAKGTS